jgi:hypothetical protein
MTELHDFPGRVAVLQNDFLSNGNGKVAVTEFCTPVMEFASLSILKMTPRNQQVEIIPKIPPILS